MIETHGAPVQENRFLNVVYASDKAYLSHTATSIFSLIENSESQLASVNLILKDVPLRDRQRISRWGKTLMGGRFTVIEVASDALPDLNDSGHVSQTTYVRFLLGDLLPASMRHVFYLDGDTLILKPLESLRANVSEIEKGGESPRRKTIHAVHDFGGDHLGKLGATSNRYFNAGVMLIDLDRWRQCNPLLELVTLARQLDQSLVWWDQDVLNLYFENDWTELKPSLNRIHALRVSTEDEIVHFAGSHKPWDFLSNHPYRPHYLYFRRKAGVRPAFPRRLFHGLFRLLVARKKRLPGG